MTSYKIGRFLAAAVRVGGVLMMIGGVAFAATGYGPPALQTSFIGVAVLLFGVVSSAVFDIADASQRGSLAQEPNYSLKRTDQSLRD